MQVHKPITTPVPDPNNPFRTAAELLPLLPEEPPDSPPTVPPVTVGGSSLGILLGSKFSPRVRVVGFATADADGT
jgi:hypothetical protein